MTKNLLTPPENYTLSQLIKYICDYGIGNKVGPDGEPIPWSPPKLSYELSAGRGRGATDVAIRQWLNEDAIPFLRQMHKLARIASGGDEYHLKLWTSALISARDAAIATRKQKKKIQKEKSSATRLSNLQYDSDVDSLVKPVPAPEIQEGTTQLKAGNQNLRLALVSVALVFVVVFGMYFYFLDAPPETSVKDIMFCDPANFSEENDVCEKSIVNFPAGTKMILVSFRIDGAEDGHKFQRRWYRNGEKWNEKHDFYDDAWPGYTFIHNESGHDLGEYALRVIIDGITYTGRFTVGEIK